MSSKERGWVRLEEGLEAYAAMQRREQLIAAHRAARGETSEDVQLRAWQQMGQDLILDNVSTVKRAELLRTLQQAAIDHPHTIVGSILARAESMLTYMAQDARNKSGIVAPVRDEANETLQRHLALVALQANRRKPA